jgi:hypothetical protein
MGQATDSAPLETADARAFPSGVLISDKRYNERAQKRTRMYFGKNKFLPLMICISVMAASCGSPSQTDTDIATAVAQTVQARNSLTEVSALPTLTPAPVLELSPTPEPILPTNPPVEAGNPGCVTSAVLVGENPPDGTIYKPGDYFWKTWTFLNSGTCIWNTSYTLNFWDGDLMGGLTSYPLSEEVAPQDTVNISIYLQAPATEGTATGFWRLKTPWGADFGVGPQSTSFYVQIGVSAKPKYGITDVTFDLVRDPAKDCPQNVMYTVVATVTSNGPVEFDYYWDQSDGNESGVRSYKFKEAGSTIFKREWMIGLGDSPNPRWIQYIITGPKYLEYERVVIDHDCFKK